MLDDLLSQVKPQLDLLLALMEAATPEDFAQALEGAREAGLADAVPSNFMQEFCIFQNLFRNLLTVYAINPHMYH